MKVLVTGAGGFIGCQLVDALLTSGYDVIATGRSSSVLPFGNRTGYTYAVMDFTDPFAVHDVFEQYKPDIVVHSGAMSKADECEEQQWQAYVTNVEGTMNVMLNAAALGSFLVFLSTDFVFDGIDGPYNETATTNPVNYYGRTKVEAEDVITTYEHAWAIVRTVLVYGPSILPRRDLLTTVKEKLEKGETFNVVDDQLRTPTLVDDLVAAMISIIEKRAEGLFHISGGEMTNPYRMCCDLATHLQLDQTLLRPVPSAYFSQAAARPLRTGLDISKAKAELDYKPRPFMEGLAITFPVTRP